MSIKISRKVWLSIGATLGLLALVWVVSTAVAQGPDGDSPISPAGGPPETWSFTYQGRLLEGGNPANGNYDFYITIWDDDTGGVQVTSPLYYGSHSVRDGIFSFNLMPEGGDVGKVFQGDDLWIQVQVRPSGTSTYTTLPRQPITAAPYAWSLRPGAVIRGSIASPSAAISVTQSYDSPGDDAFSMYGYSPSTAVYGYGQKIGVEGHTCSGHGVLGTSDHGVAVRAESLHGNLIEAWDTYPSNSRRFRITNGGDVYADGAFNPGGADFAEMLPGVDGLESGDVLVICADSRLGRSAQPYQSSVVGVYSTQPGFVGGSDEEMENPGKVPLAVVGVVPVKASAENGPIQPGDLLTTSSTPGHAMKADPNPPVGTVIGKALEGLDQGAGIIQMLVTLQ